MVESGSNHATPHPRRARAAIAETGRTPLSPEVRRDFRLRLAGVARAYAAAYFVAYGIARVRVVTLGHAPRVMVPDVGAALSIAMAIAVFFVARRVRLSPSMLMNLTLAFEVLGALGIMAGGWGWEHNFDMFQRHVFQTIGSADLPFPEGFVQRLTGAHLRILYQDGVPWVGIWLLVVPILVPMPLRRALPAAVLSALTVPGVYLLSVAVNGVPASVRPWLTDLVVDTTVPTFICAGLALFGSRTVYKLAHDLSRAQRLGSYQLEERIGAGGMGEVWLAHHHLLARPAAIKLIRPEILAGPDQGAAAELLRRFEREAQATAALRSPYSVEVYDFGVTPEGTFYYVMELLDGFDLKTLVERFGPVPPARAVHLLRQVCHSLQDAHQVGLIHRDVKPGNVFTCRRGLDLDAVKVLDFGLVKQLHGRQETIDVSAPGIARGTPAFMAPEVAVGASTGDARSDLYAVGCLAYWLVTATLVFEGPTPVATLLAHAHDAPVPPSQRTERPIPAELERVILACLLKDPARRPASARELSDQLAACVPSAGAWTETDASTWWTLHAPPRPLALERQRASAAADEPGRASGVAAG